MPRDMVDLIMGDLRTNTPECPEEPEVERVYFFVRGSGDARELVRFIRFSDGGARLMGALELHCEGYIGSGVRDAWRSGLKRIRDEGFTYLDAGPLLRMCDFPSDVEGLRQWACAIDDARPPDGGDWL